MAGNQSVRIPTLDGWRAVAILMVSVCHLAQMFWEGLRPDLVQRFLYGAFGVDIFFGISGLLITTLLLREWDATGQINLRAFYVRRAFRIVVPCFVYVMFLVAAGLIYSRTELLASLFFYRNYLNQDLFGPHTPHLWSLAVEEHFYLLWPMTLALVTPRYGQLTAGWGAILVSLWRVAAMANFPGLSNAFPYYRTDYRMDSLLWGCAMAFLIRDEKVRSLLVSRFKLVWWLLMVVALVCCVLFITIPLVRVWIPILMGFILAGTVLHPEWLFGRILELPALRWIGKLSYGLYLWQLAFIVPFNVPNKGWWQQFPQNIIIMLLVVVVSYYLLEIRLMRLGHWISARLTSRRACSRTPRRALVASRMQSNPAGDPPSGILSFRGNSRTL